MKRAFRALGLSASVLGALVAVGCGTSTTNEDVVGPGTAPPSQVEAPSYKNYADFAKAQNEQNAKPAGKGASKGQAADKGQ